MKKIIASLLLSFFVSSIMAQTDFVGVVRYTLGTPGVADAPTDSMTVVFDKMRIMVILYIPDDNKIK